VYTETLTEHDDVVGIACEGKLTEDDLKEMRALLHERLEAADRPGLVIDLTAFEGYGDLSALREDLKLSTAHRMDFRRIAVVGDRKWMEWGTALAGFLTKSEMRWFNANQCDAAVDWARRA